MTIGHTPSRLTLANAFRPSLIVSPPLPAEPPSLTEVGYLVFRS